jgi:hypothetical protein
MDRRGEKSRGEVLLPHTGFLVFNGYFFVPISHFCHYLFPELPYDMLWSEHSIENAPLKMEKENICGKTNSGSFFARTSRDKCTTG